jgi:hypothetical protein
MERLFKLYSFIFGEFIHQKEIFPNYPFSFHHFGLKTQPSFYPVIPVVLKNQQDKNSCWFFFALQPTKKLT